MKYINRYLNKSIHAVYCSICEKSINMDTPMYMITNRVNETHCYCPDCAAHYMAETMDAITDCEYSNVEG